MFNKYEGKATAYVNGKLITVDPKDTVAEAMLVEGDRIAAVGDSKEILAHCPPRCAVVDLEGRSVIPGLVDSHCHLELTTTNLELALCVSCPREVRTVGELLARIAARVKRSEPGRWIIVRGPNGMDRELAERRMPTIEELDRIAPDNPLALCYSVHYMALNTRAIEATGWRMESRLPFSATLGRDPATGKLTGVYTELWNALNLIPWEDAPVKEAMKKGMVKHFSRYGVTSVHELPYSMRGLRFYRELYEENALPLRIRYYLLHPEGMELEQMTKLGMRRGMGNRWIAFGGLKLFVDGVMGHASGFPMDDLKWTQEELNALTAKAHEAGFQIWHHTLGPEGIRASVNAYAYALGRFPRTDCRHRIEHCADRWTRLLDNGEPFVPDALKARIKALGLIPTPTPQFIYAWPDRPGAPMRTLMNDGYIIPGSSDSTASQRESSNPWHGIWCLTARENLRGRVLTPEERLTPLEAIRVFTLWAAYGGFEESFKGSLEPGKLADFCILDRDPLTVETAEIKEILPEVTVTGGRVSYSGGRFKTE